MYTLVYGGQVMSDWISVLVHSPNAVHPYAWGAADHYYATLVGCFDGHT